MIYVEDLNSAVLGLEMPFLLLPPENSLELLRALKVFIAGTPSKGCAKAGPMSE
jgi:hypothetical protein